MKFNFLVSGFYLVVPGLSAMCMFCLNVHSRDSLLCVSHSSRSKVKSCPICLSMGPHGASSHIPCREAFFCVSQVLRHDNPKLRSKDDNCIMFWGVFRRNLSLAKFARRTMPGKFACRNLPAKFAGEIRWQKLPAKFAAEFVGEIFGEKTLVKSNLVSAKNHPK